MTRHRARVSLPQWHNLPSETFCIGDSYSYEPEHKNYNKCWLCILTETLSVMVTIPEEWCLLGCYAVWLL
jgi:hypothetical protein